MLTVSDLVFERYFMPVFRPLGFVLEPGGMLVVTGTNGCGKTTLIRILAGILQPHAGVYESTALQTIYVGHQLAIKDDLNVLENIRFMQAFHGGSELQSTEIASKLGLTRVRFQPARTLSAGQRKRCALARLLLTQADLWLLDEPYSNLDADGVNLVDQLLAEHVKRGGACVLATHGSHRPPDMEISELELLPGSDATGNIH
jgi:heme exporter protein A